MAHAHAPATEMIGAAVMATPGVLLVDDHEVFRLGLRTILEEQGVRIVGEASNGFEAISRVREHAPHVVLMDIDMPVMKGVEATREIARMAPLTRVVVLTISDAEGDIIDAVLAGACGYLLKDASIDELLRGIQAALVGDSMMSPQVAAKVLQRVRASVVGEQAILVHDELSERELDVLRLIANGEGNASIAHDLYISPKTVKNHISNILTKLRIENRSQAAVYAVRSGIV